MQLFEKNKFSLMICVERRGGVTTNGSFKKETLPVNLNREPQSFVLLNMFFVVVVVVKGSLNKCQIR